ncbi:hypothetical protein U9M48_030457 [Paspalum notatum var. saurae]|uniref:Uncharacterized protein n=1 Tax=Paspalum notatum var. saurae TaxID=547442 RepID=A0AAQ3U0A9_PASNO
MTRPSWRRLHKTPRHWQKNVLFVQWLPRMPTGSESWALKASRTERSVSLPPLLPPLFPDKEEEAAAAIDSIEGTDAVIIIATRM